MSISCVQIRLKFLIQNDILISRSIQYQLNIISLNFSIKKKNFNNQIILISVLLT
jgi:hypothetical protein